MTGADLLLAVLGAVAVASGWRVFRTPSMVRASFLLLLSFVAVAGIVLMLGAPYIGAATIFMMAVEMMAMVLFMMMFMMNPAGLNPMQMVHQHRLAIGAGLVTFAGLVVAILVSPLPSTGALAGSDGQSLIHDLGIELLGSSMLTFETAGVTLLAAMVGAVVLSSRRGRYGAADSGSRPPGLEPGGEPAGQRPAPKQGHGHGSMDHGGGKDSMDSMDSMAGQHAGNAAPQQPAGGDGHHDHAGMQRRADQDHGGPAGTQQRTDDDGNDNHDSMKHGAGS